jgi:hypothetical protein
MPYNDKEQQKEASRRHYLANKDRVAARTAERRRTVRSQVYDIKASTPCADCGVRYPYYVMQFDHTGTDKVMDVSKLMRSAGLERIMAEISKCEIVCANCHSVRTWERSQ